MKNDAVRMMLTAVNTALKAMTSVKLGRNEQPNAPNRLPLKRSRKPILVLEQRIVFDGAAAVDVAHAVTDQSHAITDPVPAPPPVQVRAAEPANDNGKKEAVFIDTSVANYQTLIDGVRPGVETYLIDGTHNGLAQIAKWAETHSGYDSIHILGHGSQGQVHLGTDTLTSSDFSSAIVELELSTIGRALNSDGDLLLYGCDVGAGADGQRFIDDLAAITGADVAASTDATGSTDKGGDWSLEAQSGTIDVRELQIVDYDNLLATVSFSSSDGDIDYSYTSVTRISDGRSFTFSGGGGTGGLGTASDFGGEGLYAYEGTSGGNDIKLTISVENGYSFDISSFDVGVYTGSLTFDLTFANGSTTSFTETGINTNSWSTLSSFTTSINDVTQVVLTSGNFGLFQNFDITDVKAIVAAPTVADARISITSTGSGTGGAYKIGDLVTASWNNTGTGDNNAGITGVTMDFSQFGGGAAVTATNSSGTWTASYTIVSGAIDGANKNVSVTATNGSATTRADTTNLSVDNVAPTVTDAKISISGASGTGGAYKIGDTVTATWNNTAAGDNNSDTISAVTVDFSQFGGGSAVAATNSAGTWTATYTITSGAIDGSNKNVSITATDNAGNTKTTADTTNATVDNVAPTVSDARISLSGASGTGGAFKIGDTVTATWNNTAGGDNNSDTISGVTVDFSQFGGGSAVAATNSAGTWTATYTITSGAIDGSNKNVSITATDNAGNTKTTADTTNATLDNVAPTVTNGNISISGASGTGGAYKVGDTITATWNNTAGGDNNSDTISSVTVDFSAFGGGAAVAASNSSGTWTATYTIVAGAIDGTNKNVSVTATDNAGNSTTTADTTNATLDNVAPTVTNGNISISGASGTGGAYKVGDTITATWNNTAGGDNNSDTISSVTVDFSQFGGGSAVAATNSSGTWTATYTIVSGAINGTTNRNVSVTATDNAGNTTTTADTANATVDNVAPTTTIATAAFSADTGTSSTDFITKTAAQTISGTTSANIVSGEIVEVSLDNGSTWTTATTSVGANTWSLSGQTLTASNTLKVRVTDTAGNNGTTASQAYVLDTTAPTTTIATKAFSADTGTSSTDFITKTAAQTISGTTSANIVSGEIVEVSLDNGSTWTTATTSVGANTWSLSGQTLTASNTLKVRVTDTAGNNGTTASQAYVLDTTAPTTTIATKAFSADTGTSSTDFITKTAAQTISGTTSANIVSGEIVEVSLDNGSTWTTATTSVGANTWSLSGQTLTASNTLKVRVTDTAGNNGTTASQAYVLDTTAPAITFSSLAFSSDTGSSSSDFITKTAAQTITATLSGAPGGTDIVYGSLDNGSSWTNITSKVSGTTLTWDGVTLTSSSTLKLKVTDAAGNDGTVASQAYTLDTTAPSAPSTPNMTGASDTGSSSSDDITSDTTPTFFGTAEASSTVTLYDTDGTTVLATVTANGAGNWLMTSSALSAGSHTITAKATDAAGNVSSASSGLTIVIDTAAPTGIGLNSTTIVSSNATSTSTIATLSATDGQAITYSLAVGNGTNDADNGSFTISGTSLRVGGSSLGAGTYKIYVAARDAAGNIANQAFTLTVVDAPSVSSVVRTGGASSTVNTAASSISYTVTFSESVTGVDTSDFAVTATGTASGNIASVSGSGTTYTVVVDTISGDGTLRLDLNNSGTGIQNGSSVAIAAGYTSGSTYTLDHTAPSAPSTPDMTSGTDSGLSSSDNITNNTTPTFTGTAESGSTVTLYDTDGTTVLGTGTATGGNWSITSSALSAGSHTITAKATDAAGNASSASSGLSVTIDNAASTVASVSVPSDGSYKAGQTLSFTVNTDEAVTVDTSGGTPRLALNVGGASVYAAYASGSGSSALVFTYTVQNGDTDSDGITVTALQTNGGTLKDTAGNNMNVSLNSVASTTSVLVDTTAPVVNSVLVPSNGAYYSNQNLDFTVNFSEAVTVDTSGGTPRIALTLDTGGTVYASYLSGSGTTKLVFRYTVADGVLDNTGVTVGALGASGGTLRDVAGNDATLTLNSVGSTASVNVDGTQPRVFDVTSTTANGIYNAGNTVSVNVAFSKAVTVDTTGGTPTLSLGDGGTATYTSGSGSTTLVFTYTVADGENSADLDYASTSALALNGGTIKDSGGSHLDAVLTLASPGTSGSLGASNDIVVDTTPPPITFSNLAFSADTGTSSTDFITKTAAQTITATLSGAPAGTDIVYGSLDNGATWTDITSKVSGTTLTWNGVTLTGNDTFKLKVTDSAGNDGTVASQTYALDTTAPNTPPTPDMTSGTDTGSSSSDNITSDDTPTFTGTAESGSTVTVYDTDGTTVLGTGTATGGNWSITSSALSAGSHTITAKATDAAGNTSSASSGLSLTMDTTAPTVSSVTVPADGNYKAGTVLSFTINTSETVMADTSGGTPRLALNMGGSTVYANYASGSGSSALVFTYTVQPGDNDADGITVSALQSNGGTLNDSAGNDMTLTLNSVGSTANVLVDTTAPINTIATAALSADTGTSTTDFITKTAAQTISGTLASNLASGEKVYVSLDNGTTWTEAATATGQNTWSLAGQTLTGSDTLKIKITDAAGNDGPVYSQAYMLDTTAPSITFSSVAFSADAGTSSTDFITKTAVQTISATLSSAPAGTDVVYGSLDNGATWTDITSKVSGTTLTWDGVTLAGSNTLKLKVTDNAGNDGTVASQAYVLDTTAPNAASTPDMTSGTDTGSSSSDNITNNTTPTFTGTAESGSTVTLYDTDGTTVLGTGTATGGNWSITSSALSAGSHTITAKATDAAGNASSASSGLSVTIDNAASTVASVSVPSDGSYKAGQTLSFTVNTDEAVTVDTSGGTPRLALNVGGATVYAAYASGSGSSALMFTYTVQNGDTDTDGITVTALQTNGGTLKDTAGNNMNVSLNSIGSTGSVLVDTTAPTITFSGLTFSNDTGTSNSDLITKTAAQTITATLSGAPAADERVYGSLDNGATWTDITSKVSGTSLTWDNVTLAGSNTLKLKVTDAAGNGGAVTSQAYTLDVTAPTTTVATVSLSADTGSSSTDFITKTAAQTISGTLSAATVSGEIVEVSLDNGITWAVATNTLGQSTWSLAGQTLAGSDTLTVRVTDAAGNDGTAASQAYVLDTTAAAPTLALAADTGNSNTDTITGNGTINVTGLETGASWQYSTDGGTNWNTGSGTSFTLSGEGTKSVMIKQTDIAGNTSSNATLAFTLDTTAPAVPDALMLDPASDSGISSTDRITSITTPTITGTAEAGTIVTLYDTDGTTVLGTGTADVMTGAWSIATTPLSNGVHTLTAKTTDAAGTESAASAGLSLTIDAVAPSITGAVANQLVSDNATLTPFASIIISESGVPSEIQSITIALDTPTKGVFSNLAGGTYNATTGTYTFAGTATEVTAAVNGLVFTPAENRVLPGEAETITFTIVVTNRADATASNAATTVIAASVNDAPVRGAGSATNQTGTEGKPFSYTVAANTFTDVDAGDSLSYSATLSSGAPLPSWLSFNAVTRTFSGTPGSGDVGAINVKITGTDAAGARASVNYQLTIIAVPPPVPTTPPIVPLEHVVPTIITNSTPMVLTPTFSHVNIEVVEPRVSGLPAMPALTRSDGFQVVVPPHVGDLGTSTPAVLSIGQGISDHQIISGSDPIFIRVPHDAFVHTRADAQIMLSATMVDGSPLPTWLHFDPIKGEFTGTPDGTVTEVLSIKVIAHDDSGNQVETIFHIQVNERHSQFMSGKPAIAEQFRRDGMMGWKAERDRLVQHAQQIAAKNNVPGRQYDHLSKRSS